MNIRMSKWRLSLLATLLTLGLIWVTTLVAQIVVRPHTPVDVDPFPGCDFNGNCYSDHGDEIVFRSGQTERFAWRMGRSPRWLITPFPVNNNDAVGIDLEDFSHHGLSITLRFCPASGACADQQYASPEAYAHASIAQTASAEHAAVKSGRQLPVSAAVLRMATGKASAPTNSAWPIPAKYNPHHRKFSRTACDVMWS